MKKKIGIVIPAYNEESNIINISKAIKKKVKNSSIIIVDDSFHNKTSNLIKKKKLKVNYIHRKKKLGRGSAVLFGLKKLLKDKSIEIFIELDADFSHSPEELPRNIKYFKKKSLDLLIGSRYLRKSKIANWGLSRRIFSSLANRLASSLLKIPINDLTNGYRIYSKKAVKRIVKNCGNIGDGFIILSEILVELYLNRLKIDEIESHFVNRQRGESSVNFRLIIESLFGLIKLYINKRKRLKSIYKERTFR